ncbi:hypothetical protein TNIN_376231 [Trichonephila inaurata madagascariensis]|uniref:Uncharacterized protein n=1 Tax=Trichonephila inaurata madagascariensis TaxID=2747483 RepID=A0A8X7C9Y3_9ARAC|nr:hypothetical protein TNIN_376231 [Trichonephila inaurata madagascariensis]
MDTYTAQNQGQIRDVYQTTNILFLSLLFYRGGIKEAISRQKAAGGDCVRGMSGKKLVPEVPFDLDICSVRQDGLTRFLHSGRRYKSR